MPISCLSSLPGVDERPYTPPCEDNPAQRGGDLIRQAQEGISTPQIYLSVDAALTGPPYHQTQPDRKENGK